MCVKTAFCNFACSELMTEAYSKEFGTRFVTLYTPFVPNYEKVKIDKSKPEDEIVFVYAGNLGYKRYEVLISIAEAIETLNFKGVIRVFGNCDDLIRSELSKHKAIILEGFVDAKTLSIAYQQSDVVLHVESFDKKMAQITRYSISTKIPDLLGSGKLIFAIGPTNQAAIDN